MNGLIMLLQFIARILLLLDLEDMREDLDDDEYVEGKADTLKQMEEFEQSLSKMMVCQLPLVHVCLSLFMTNAKLINPLYLIPDRRYDVSVRPGGRAAGHSGGD